MSTNTVLFKKILTRNILLPILLGIISCAIFVGIIFYLISVNRWVEHTDQVIARTEALQKVVIDAENGLRGYSLTRLDTFLEPYKLSVERWREDMSELKNLVADSEVQVRRLDGITTKFEVWLKYSENVLALGKKDKIDRITEVMMANKFQMEKLRQSFHDLLSEEYVLRDRRSLEAHAFVKVTLSIIVIFTLLSSFILAIVGRRQLMTLSAAYETVLAEQNRKNELLRKDQWIKSNDIALAEAMLAKDSLTELSEKILIFLADTVGADAGVVYMNDENSTFFRLHSVGTPKKPAEFRQSFTTDETLLGRAVKQKKVAIYSDLPENYMTIASGIGEAQVREVAILPTTNEGEVNGVIELGFTQKLDQRSLEFLKTIGEKVGVAIQGVRYRERLENLLHEVQAQSEELQAQQEELRVSNEELDNQAKLLKESQIYTEAQNAELEQTNYQLSAQAKVLEEQRDDIDKRNDSLIKSQEETELKAAELQLASQYKSEFLANMSHELRTPLNSSLILAQLLTENKDGNLSNQQVNFARQIVKSGNDLLLLINDILDLSKVESGKLDINLEEITLQSLLNEIEKVFHPLASNKGIDFKINCNLPTKIIISDRLRLEQILKNLLSNAVKFTNKGSVYLNVTVDEKITDPSKALKFAIVDTGVGIKSEQHGIIFEAFKQADGTTSRHFGGTGLGLSISQNLARLLGGHIEVTSEFDKGSTFQLLLPLNSEVFNQELETSAPVPLPVSFSKYIAPAVASKSAFVPVGGKFEAVTFIEDDRHSLKPESKTILVVEDDLQFGMIIRDLAREMGFKALVTDTADQGIYLAEEYKPLAIILDVMLPDHSGLFVLDQLKRNPSTRHIPVHVVSVEDFATQAFDLGAIGYLLKPMQRDQLKEALTNLESFAKKEIKKVLIVEDDEIQNEAIQQLISGDNIQISSAKTGENALRELAENIFDCVILDLTLPDMTGISLLEKLSTNEGKSYPPVIVYTGRDLSKNEEMKIRQFSKSIIIKGVKSPERLLDQVTLFLHQVEAKLPADRQRIISNIRHRDQSLNSKRILVVDDDLRNVFALTSALESRGAIVKMEKNGRDALETLKVDNKFDVVLMDIMMPIMDGYETIAAMRSINSLRQTPVIALTAKAMKDDRERALKAGADDYLPKPIDLEKLISLIRVWTSTHG